MNAYLRDKLLQKLDSLSDERGYQVLDYVDFLESKYAERATAAGGGHHRPREDAGDGGAARRARPVLQPDRRDGEPIARDHRRGVVELRAPVRRGARALRGA